MKADIFVILTFDIETIKRINEFIEKTLENSEIILYPHITIAHFSRISEKKILKHSNIFMEKFKNETIVLKPEKIGYLTDDIIACFFEQNLKLYQIYNEYNEKYIKKLDFQMLKENWVPHCTIFSGDKTKVKKLFKIYKNQIIDFNLTIDKLQLSKMDKENNFEIIFSHKFIR